MNLSEVQNVILEANQEELNRIRQFVAIRQSVLTQKAVFSIRSGDRVEWRSSKYGRLLRGTVVRPNRKSVSINADDGIRWRVHPSYLTVVGKEV